MQCCNTLRYLAMFRSLTMKIDIQHISISEIEFEKNVFILLSYCIERTIKSVTDLNLCNV